jgi:hypothetical protein
MKSKKKKNKIRKSERNILDHKYIHWITTAILILSFVIFFHKLFFQSKNFISSDYISSIAYLPFVEEAEEQGLFPLWTPYLFSGLPSYASMIISGDRWYDFTHKFFQTIYNSVRYIFWDRYIFVVILFHVLFGIAVYMLAFHKTKNAAAALFAAISISFCLGIIIWAMEGHYTKARSLISLPLLLILVEQMRSKIKAWHILAAIVLIHMHGVHIQMVFYSAFALGIYFLFFAIRNAIKKESIVPVVKTAVVLGFCAGIAFFMQSDRYFSTYEYNQYSIRGVGPIVETDETTGRPGGGLDYEYATNWSFSPQEIATFFIPSFYGYGNWTYEGALTQNRPVRVNTYFGQMPFTVAPVYMGIVFLALGIIGIAYYRKEPFVQYLMVLSGIALLISFGRTLPILYDPMYHFFPLFDKFRVPSMILIVVHIAFAVFAAYGIMAITELGKQRQISMPMWLRRTLVIIGTFFVLSFLARGVFENSYISLIENSGRPVSQQLYPWIYGQMMNDLSFNLGLLLVAFGGIALYLRKSIPAIVLIGLLIVLSTTDLWRQAYRPMDLHPAQNLERLFEPDNAVQFIKEDDSLFRVFQIQNDQPSADNRLSYHLVQDIYGYHPAKLRVYQDMIEVAGIGNPFLWNILNVKYILSDRFYDLPSLEPVFDGQRKVMQNTDQLPRVWFVDRIEERTPISILQLMRDADFHPLEVAFVEESIGVDIDTAGDHAFARITDFGIHHIQADVLSEGNQFLVISEVYYPAGWNAYLNGEKVDIVKTNYFMRGVIIPEGEHTLEMLFEPRAFAIGKTISIILNIFVIGFALILGGRMIVLKRKSRTTITA